MASSEVAAAPVLWIEPSDSLPHASFHLVRARVEWPDAAFSEGWGRDVDAGLAQVKAMAEAVERAAHVRLPATAFEASAVDLPNVLAPASLVRYEDAQYEDPTFPLRRFCAKERRWWLVAEAIAGQPEAAVAADFVCNPRAFEPTYRTQLLTHANSSGCASGRSVADAVLRAVLELVERDAFMRHWFAQCPGRPVHAGTLPGWAAARMEALLDAGCSAGVQCLTLGAHPVWLTWAQHGQLHFTSLGAATGLDAEPALRSALEELETQALSRLAGVPAQAIAPLEVRSPADHAALYASPACFRWADAVLLGGEPVSFQKVAGDFRRGPYALYESLRAQGHPPFWVDLSLSAASNALEGEPLYTVRALAPGLIPLAFGHGMQPLGMAPVLTEAGRRLHPFS